MTPQEKAKELIDQFKTVVIQPFPEQLLCMDDKEAKQCALITVDEIIKSIPADAFWYEIKNTYWRQVKEEIEKL